MCQYVIAGIFIAEGKNLLLELLLSSNLFDEERHLDDIELIVQVLNLLKVLLLHLSSGIALFARVVFLGEQQLVNHNSVCVNLIAVQLLNHSLRLVQRQELGNAYTDKGSQVCILELSVDLADGSAQILHLLDDIVQALALGEAAAGTENAVEHGTELTGELGDLSESLLHDGGELKEAEGMAGGCGIENDALVAERLDLLEDFGERHGFIDTGNLFG